MNDQEATVALQEALRRRSGQMPSTSVIGAPTANAPVQQNPLQQEAMTPQAQSPMPQGGAQGFAMQGAMNGLKTQKGESEMIIKSLTDRLKKLPPSLDGIQQQYGQTAF